MAKALAKKLSYVYIDTGAMYRAVTLFALRHQLFNVDGSVKEKELKALMPDIHIRFQLDPATGNPRTILNDECVEKEIRGMEVSQHVSPIAAIPFVREALVAQQQTMGKEKGIVMDGRIFVTASAQVRAQRRYDELKAKGMPADFNDILKNVQERDYIDTHREVSPLKKADDAVELDNGNMTIAEQNQWLYEQYLAHLPA